jgi:Mg2+ and Co2+ transporter CorA
MFDDIVFYWQQADQRQIDSVFDKCVNTTLFVHQILACHWFEFLDLQLKTLSAVDLTSKKKRGDSVRRVVSTEEWKDELDYLNERLSLLGMLQRRLMWYEQEMLLNLERLGLAPDGAGDDLSTTAPASLRVAKRDFQAVFYQLNLHKSRADNLVGIVTDSINLSGALRSLHDARFGLQLSIVGAIFFPVTLVAAIFSMGGDYQPGSKDFWIPWVVAVPLVVILVFMIWQSRRSSL